MTDTTQPPAETLAEAIEYMFGDDRRGDGPRVVDLCYTAFLNRDKPNPDDGGKSDWFTDTKPIIDKQIAAMKARILAALTRRAGGDAREWPDIGEDPMKGTPYEDRMAVSAAALRKAYTVQQPIVPDQTALVWRWHIAALLEAEIRLRSILARDDYAGDPDGDEPVNAGGDAIPAGERLALRAIKAVTATGKDGPRALSRIMAITISAGVEQQYTELLADPDVALIVERPRTEWAHLFKPGTTGCAIPPDGWECSRERGHDGPCAATPKPPAGGDAGAVERLADALRSVREYVERKSQDAFDDREDRLLAVIDTALALPAPVGEGERWRHVKRGTIYEVIGYAELQNGNVKGLREGAELAVYRGEDGKLWARERGEFHDGRFAALSEGRSHG